MLQQESSASRKLQKINRLIAQSSSICLPHKCDKCDPFRLMGPHSNHLANVCNVRDNSPATGLKPTGKKTTGASALPMFTTC